MKRIFAAIKIQLPPPVLTGFKQMRDALCRERITWVNPELMHLTIKFFGETPENSLSAIEHCLGQAVENVAEFPLAIEGTGIFGSSYQPKVIWFGVKEPESVNNLAAAVNEQLKTIGIFPDRQNFVPHLTIARIKQISQPRYFQQVIDQYKNLQGEYGNINEMMLYESILRKEGPMYIPLKRFALRTS